MNKGYRASGAEGEFEPGSRGRVLGNKLGIKQVSEIQEAESAALWEVQKWAVAHFGSSHRFSVADIKLLHRRWLGEIYTWAGEFRSVNVSKDGFMFAAAGQVPRLMGDFEKKELCRYTPCNGMNETQLIRALARTHAELVLIHLFRDGNGRCARLLASLMSLQAGLPALDYLELAGRGEKRYIAAVQSALDRDYEPMEDCFSRVIATTLRLFGDGGEG